MLIVGSDEAAIGRALEAVEAFGLRSAGAVALAGAASRLELQGSASAVWIELGRDGADVPSSLVERLNADVQGGRYGAIVSAPREMIDPLFGTLNEDVQLIIDADQTERASALAIALAMRNEKQQIREMPSERRTEQLRKLSDEVGRIAASLARLSAGPSPELSAVQVRDEAESAPLAAETVGAVIRARRLRSKFFSEELFADPAWDMLLDLLKAEILHLRVPVSSLCIAAAVPATTALRWLKSMVNQKLFIRRADPLDGRRVFVELAPETSSALRRYFAAVGPMPVI